MRAQRRTTTHARRGMWVATPAGMATVHKTPTDPTQQAEQKFIEVLRSFDYAMLVSSGAGEAAHARPMAIAEASPDGTLWFLTGKDTHKAFELAEQSDALAVMQGDSRYLSVSGRAHLVDDRARIHKLWKEPMRVWFDGKDDPNIVLICLEPQQAEYWNNKGREGVRLALRFAKAYLTGDSPMTDPEDVATHAKVQL